jgi:hypothetical protein
MVDSPKHSTICITGLIVMMCLAACGTSSPVVQNRLDPTTGITITHTEEPIILYHDGSSRAAFAGDYINVGPIQVNRMGQHRYFLWLGVWSTMPAITKGNANDATSGFESIVVYADGEPLQLELAGRTPSAIGASEAVYVPPSHSSTDGYYEVTADQLRFISQASDIRLQTTGANSRSYEPWNGQESGQRGMQAFVDYLSY